MATLLDKLYKLSDSGGLYLIVNHNGSKYWKLLYVKRSRSCYVNSIDGDNKLNEALRIMVQEVQTLF